VGPLLRLSVSVRGRGRAKPALAAGLLAIVLACGGAARASGTLASVYVLLADNRLMGISLDGRASFSLRLGSAQRWPSVGRFLALDRGTLVVLVRGSRPGLDRLVFVDTARRAVVARLRLPGRTLFRSVALAPQGRRLYVVGDRPESGPQQQPVVAAVDLRARRLLWSRLVQRAEGFDWLVYRAVVEPGEHSLLVGYHGSTTTGADRLVFTADGIRACDPPPGRRAGLACIALHGNVEPNAGRLVAATGDGRTVLVLDRDGKELRRLDPRLPRNHLMEFALDRRRGLLYAVGSCGYAGGLSETSLAGGRARVLERAGDRSICGERIAVASPSLLAIGRTDLPVPDPGAPGAVLLVRPADGAVAARVPTPAEPVDLLPVPART
jgi:hypothetical protein